MARPNRMTSEQEALKILKQGTYGVLSTVSPDGTPYAVPLNYAYLPAENCIIFHCATAGEKIDAIKHNSHVCFVVVGPQEIIPDRYTTHYESAVAYGTAALTVDDDEKRRLLAALCDHLTPGEPTRDAVIEKFLPAVAVCKIAVSRVTGKRNED